MSLAFAFLLACTPSLHAAQPRPEAPAAAADPDSLRSRLEGRRRNLEVMLDDLKKLGNSSGEAKYSALSESELDALDVERSRLRKELDSGQAELAELNGRYRTLSILSAASQMQNIIGGGKRGSVMKGKLAGALGDDAFFHEISAFTSDVRGALRQDEEQFGDARRTLEGKRLHRRLAALLLAAILVVASAGLWMRRRSSGARGAFRPASAAATKPAPAGPTISPGVTAPAAGLSAAPQAGLSAPAAASRTLIGSNFQAVRELGRGSIGLAVEALDLTLQRKVVLKKLREELLQSPDDLELLLSGTRLVASLKHPGIAEIHGVVREAGQVYLVLEHVSGRPLNRALEEQGRLLLPAIHALLAHAGAALDYAHSRGVIHGGIKPSNIMLTDDRKVKVTDFGLARRTQATAARLAKAESWCAPAYTAPEQKPGTVSRESDLYSLCVCVYESAVGRPAFSGPDFPRQKRELLYVPPSQAARLPPAFDAFMRKGLQPDPALRYQSAAEILAAMGALAKA